ncbi:MAG: PKD domain-containing protein [Bacteroidota bacterium]
MKKYIVYILLMCIVSCKKNIDPVGNTGNPEFNVTGLVNSQNLNITAGIDDFYLFTDYGYDSTNDIITYVSEFKKPCIDCKESLKIIIRNNHNGKNVPFAFDSIFGYSNYNYYIDNPTNYKVNFFAADTINTTHQWDFGDGTSSTLSNPTKLFPSNNNPIITYKSTNTVTACTSSIAKKIFMNADTINLVYPDMNIFPDADTAQNVSIYFNDTSNIKTISWQLGDGDTSSSKSVYHKYTNPGIYLVKATITTVYLNQTIEVSKNIAINTTACKANFNFTITPEHNIPQFSTVIIEYTDKNGEVWRSNIAKQDASSYFKVLSKEPYLLNEKNQATHRFDVEWNCILSNGSSKINMNNVKAKIAFAHP